MNKRLLIEEESQMQVVLHSRLKPGAEASYERDHLTVPDDLMASFARVGIRNWTIWRSGLELFHLVECDDFAAAMAALAGDPANERWQAFIGPHVEGFASTGDGPEGQVLGQVWQLAEQRGSVR
jgi:L-rhamnose mutarotase